MDATRRVRVRRTRRIGVLGGDAGARGGGSHRGVLSSISDGARIVARSRGVDHSVPAPRERCAHPDSKHTPTIQLAEASWIVGPNRGVRVSGVRAQRAQQPDEQCEQVTDDIHEIPLFSVTVEPFPTCAAVQRHLNAKPNPFSG